MEIVGAIILIVVSCYIFFRWLYPRFRGRAHINPGMFKGRPILSCTFDNYFGNKPITVRECHLVVDNQLSPLVVSKNVPLPQTVQIREGFGVYFDALQLVAEAREKRQDDFKVRALFYDNADRAYLSKPITIQTDRRRFIRPFEDTVEHNSEPVKNVIDMAQEITEQLDQQYVGIPHLVLALIRESNGVGGHVLREFGLNEDFLLSLAKHSPNVPRDRERPLYQSMEVQKLVYQTTRDEARKMRQRCHGTGHLLLGLIRQKDKAFRTILKQFEIQPRQLGVRIYEELRKDQYQTDHPTLPPEGIKRYIWALWYQFAHAILKAILNIGMILSPNPPL